MDFGLVLRRPIETTRLTGHVGSVSGNRVWTYPGSQPVSGFLLRTLMVSESPASADGSTMDLESRRDA